MNIFEIFIKKLVKSIEIRFAFYQDCTAKLIEAGQTGMSQAFFQSGHQRQPFIHGNINIRFSQKIEKR
jgi:hypothetical protein